MRKTHPRRSVHLARSPLLLPKLKMRLLLPKPLKRRPSLRPARVRKQQQSLKPMPQRMKELFRRIPNNLVSQGAAGGSAPLANKAKLASI